VKVALKKEKRSKRKWSKSSLVATAEKSVPNYYARQKYSKRTHFHSLPAVW